VTRALPISIVALAAALFIAAPASAKPLSVAQFSMAAPAAKAQRSAGGTVTSRPLRAPKRFDLVGLRGRGRSQPAVSLRVRRDRGRWSRWAKVGSEAPAWAGPSDWVQYRLSHPAAGVRLEFVNVTGTAPRVPGGARAAARSAQAGAPPILPRSAWGASQCPPRVNPIYGQVQVAFVHHTVSINDYTEDDVPAMILGICRYHRNTNGWNDIGYNFLVDKFGRIWEGRAGGIDQPVVGAQAQGYNSQSTGIANLGTYDSAGVSAAALDSMARLIRWKLPLSGAPTTGSVVLTSAGGPSNRYRTGTQVTLARISGHRDADSTACPGAALYGQLAELRAKVGDVEPATPRTKISAVLSTGRVRYGESAVLSGTLRTMKGEPVGGLALNAQELRGGSWRTIASTTTGADGSFSLAARPSRNGALRAEFDGAPGFLGSFSKQALVQVRAAITLKRSVSRASVGRTPSISGSISPAKRSVTLIVEKRVGRANRRVARYVVPVRNGRFRKAYRLRSRGLYRYRAVFAGDSSNLRVQSAAVYVRALGSKSGGVASSAHGVR
jgi:hypothetical protein